MPGMNVVADNRMAMVPNICRGEGTSIFDFRLPTYEELCAVKAEMKLLTEQWIMYELPVFHESLIQ
jgi:hypothetical protein